MVTDDAAHLKAKRIRLLIHSTAYAYSYTRKPIITVPQFPIFIPFTYTKRGTIYRRIWNAEVVSNSILGPFVRSLALFINYFHKIQGSGFHFSGPWLNFNALSMDDLHEIRALVGFRLNRPY